MKPKFNNRKNQPVELPDGRTIWHARSCAVVAAVCMYNVQESTWYILLQQRGSGTPDFQGYWCMPCGYLDWDETLCNAVIREVWEECGLHLPALSKTAQFVYSPSSLVNDTDQFTDTPWSVADRIDNTKQNISMHFAVMFAWAGAPLPAITNAYADPDEVIALDWVPIKNATYMDLAFGHHKRIAMLMEQRPDLFQMVEQNSTP